jgi:DNA end-binding protein Ku
MPARAIASATVSFGLVSIPIKIYAASASKSVHFNMLHARDKGRLKQQYVCSVCGETVERADTVKGYEYQRDQYVVMEEEELKALETKGDRSIEIEDFVPIERVDPVYFDRSNLLGPDKGGQKAYRLLNEAMTVMGKVAVGRYATRGRQQLVLLRPMQRGLVLHGLFYADEVRSFDEVGGDVELKKGELDLANQLIEQLSRDRFEPGRYEDEYRRAVLAAVDRKVAGEEVVVQPRAEAREQIIDLVAALKQSLAEKRGGEPPPARARKPAKAKGKEAGAAGRKAGSR